MNILRIALTDLRLLLKEKITIFWMLILPLMITFLFGNMSGDPSKQTTWIPVVNLDGHELSTLFIEQLKAEGYNIDPRSATDEKYVKGWYRAVIIPATFSESLLTGERVDLTFVKGNRNFEDTLSAQSRLVHTIVRFTGALAKANVILYGWDETTKDDLLEELSKPQILTVKKESHGALRPPPFGFAFSLPGYLIMFVLMNSIMAGGISLAEERMKKRLTRLYAAPLLPLEIFVAKVLGKSLTPLVQSCLLLGLGCFFFGVSFGDHPLALLPVLLSFALFAGSLSMLCGLLCSTEQQVSSVGILITMILSALGGCWWPIEIAPDSLKTLAACTPTFWGLQGLHDVMSFGKGFTAVFPECLILLGFASILTTLSVWVMHRQQS